MTVQPQKAQWGWKLAAAMLCGWLLPAGVSADLPLVPLLKGASELHADADHDGVTDYHDRCPATAPGAEVDEFGCADRDGDSVIDPVDQCPQTPRGAEVDAFGCRDSDRDGIENHLDQCPRTPTGEAVFSNGCAARESVQFQAVYFDSGSVEVDATAIQTLLEIARAVSGTGFMLEVAGHSDSSGSAQANLALSLRRADAVASALKGFGLSGDQVTVLAMGARMPVADNGTEAGRRKNRRVTLKVRRR